MTYEAGDAFIRFSGNFDGMIERATAEARRAGDAYARAFQDELRRHQPVIRPDVDGGRAAAELAALRAEVDRLRQRVDIRVNTNAASATKDTHGLLKSLLALSPAVVPLAGAAAAAGGALAAMGVAGVLAVKGIKTEMDAGTKLGVAYAAQINVAKTAFATLQKTAATNFFAGFQGSVSKLNTALPAFNTTIGSSSKILGDIASHLAGGLAAGFHTFEPVIVAVETSLDSLAKKFEAFASSAQGAKFAQTLVNDFHQISELLGNVASAIAHVAAAAAPVGSALISVFNGIAEAINHIPLPALTALITALSALGTAGIVSRGIVALGGSLGRVGVGLSALAPYAAVAVGLHIAFNAAANATDSWATSSNALKAEVHQTAVAMKDLFSLNVKGFLSNTFGQGAKDAAVLAGHVNALRDSLKTLDQNQNSFSRVSVNGNTSSLGGSNGLSSNSVASSNASETADAQVATYRRAITGLLQIQKQFNVEMTKAPLSKVSGDYLAQASAIDKSNQSLGKFLNSGDDLGKTYQGVTIRSTAYDAALAKTNGDAAKAIGIVRGQIDAYNTSTGVTGRLSDASLHLSTVIGAAQAKYKLTSDQIDLYGSVLDVNGRKLANNRTYQDAFTIAVGGVARAVSKAGVSFSNYLAAVSTFNASTKTATDKAALLSAALTANVGDTLSTTTANLQAATSAEGVANAFAKYSDAVSSNGNILGQATKTAHGYVILQPKLTEGGLAIASALQQQSDSAIAAASSLYQTEVRTKGQSQATKDATGLYMGYRDQLKTTLISQGLSADAAQHMTDKYLGVPTNLKTFAKLFGKGDIEDAVSSLTTTLAHFGRIIATAIAKLNTDNVTTGYNSVIAAVQNLNGKSVTIPVKYKPVSSTGGVTTLPGGGKVVTGGGAAGGYAPDGFFTVGEGGPGARPELAYKDGNKLRLWSTPESHKVADAFGLDAPGLHGRPVKGFAGGTGTPSLVTVDPNAAANAAADSKATKDAAKAAADLKEKLQAATQAERSFLDAVGLTVNPIRAAEHAMLGAAKAAGASAKELAELERIADRLAKKSNQLNKVEARLGTAPTAPTAYEQLATARQAFKDLKSSIVDAIKGGFTIATAGVRSNAFGDSVSQGVLGSFSLPSIDPANDPAATAKTKAVRGLGGVSVSTTQPVLTAGFILSTLKKTEADAHRFVDLLKKLASEGLPQGLLDQLASAGPSALSQAEALRAATPKQLASIKSTYKALTGDSNALSKPAVTFGSIYGDARKAAQDARALARGLRKLASDGLDPNLIAQLAQAGVASLPQVEALLDATPKQLAALNHQEHSLAHTGAALGTATAGPLYDAGIQAAQGLVEGLRSQERQLKKQMKHLADIMVKQLKKDLGIASPSKVGIDIGANLGGSVGSSAVHGVRQHIPNMTAAVGELANARYAVGQIENGTAQKFSDGTSINFGGITQMPNEDGGALAERVASRVTFALASR